MPYKLKGLKILHFKSGRWSVKQTATSIKKAKATIRLLEGVEHGGDLLEVKSESLD